MAQSVALDMIAICTEFMHVVLLDPVHTSSVATGAPRVSIPSWLQLLACLEHSSSPLTTSNLKFRLEYLTDVSLASLS
jgi:hypothetical protein